MQPLTGQQGFDIRWLQVRLIVELQGPVQGNGELPALEGLQRAGS